MPLSAVTLKTFYQSKIAPGNDAEFYRLLLEADSRLLSSGRWHWTRKVITLVPDELRMVYLPEGYSSIVGCRLGSVPAGIKWQESEYMEDGPSQVPIEGCTSYLIDKGLVDDPTDSNSDPAQVRGYLISDEITESVSALAKFSPVVVIDEETDYVRCPNETALKQMMMSIVFEEAGNPDLAIKYAQMAGQSIFDHEQSYRGIAKQIFKPNVFRTVPRRSKTNFP